MIRAKLSEFCGPLELEVSQQTIAIASQYFSTLPEKVNCLKVRSAYSWASKMHVKTK